MENLLTKFLTHKKSFSRKEISNGTLDFYNKKIKKAFDITGLIFEDLGSQEKVENAWEKINTLRYKTSSKVKFLVSLQQISDFLLKKGIILENEARKIPVPAYENDMVLPLSDEEVEKCQDFIKNRWKGTLKERNLLIFNLFLYSGIRHSELTHLQKKDIYSDKIFIHKGKGKKSRMVALPRTFGQELFNFSQNFKEETDLVFHGKNGNVATSRMITAIFHYIQKGTNTDVYPHKLRHTYASNGILAGLDFFTLKEQLGHSDIRTTLKYLAITNERRVQEVQHKIHEIHEKGAIIDEKLLIYLLMNL